jgi:hypothetical protein
VIDGESTRNLLGGVGRRIIGLDNVGGFWELRGDETSSVRAWRRLPIPPLPDNERAERAGE